MIGKPTPQHQETDFSLVLGGPLYQFLLRTGLVRPPIDLLHRRVAALVLVTWVPLAVLSAFEGTLLGGPGIPFLRHIGVHANLLAIVPLLIWAEVLSHGLLRTVVDQFRDHGLIAPEDEHAFEAIKSRVLRLRNSMPVELLLLVLSFTGGYWLWRMEFAPGVDTWIAINVDGATHFTWAGYWYAFLCLPIARFILFRWYFRLFIWYLFLFRVSRLHLRLSPLHPDRSGGLGFLCISVDAFAPLVVAQSAFVSARIAGWIWYENVILPQFKIELVVLVAMLMLVALLPLAFFAPQMVRARRAGLRDYGEFAGRYAAEFQQKWLQRNQPGGEALLGSADIQSLADLANSYDVVREMGVLPFGRAAVLRLLILIALPLLPLTLTMFSLEEMVTRLIKVVL